MIRLSDPQIIEHAPYQVVGVCCPYEGDDEGPGWSGADSEFSRLRHLVTGRTDDMLLGFLYRPHRDHPEIAESVRACFIGVDVSGLVQPPEGMSLTRFSGGQYAVVASIGDTADEAAQGVGEAIGFLSDWMPEHGYREGDACFACSDERAIRPPHVEYVYMKLETAAPAELQP